MNPQLKMIENSKYVVMYSCKFVFVCVGGLELVGSALHLGTCSVLCSAFCLTVVTLFSLSLHFVYFSAS